jgi:hypothetical protein
MMRDHHTGYPQFSAQWREQKLQKTLIFQQKLHEHARAEKRLLKTLCTEIFTLKRWGVVVELPYRW